MLGLTLEEILLARNVLLFHMEQVDLLLLLQQLATMGRCDDPADLQLELLIGGDVEVELLLDVLLDDAALVFVVLDGAHFFPHLGDLGRREHARGSSVGVRFPAAQNRESASQGFLS